MMMIYVVQIFLRLLSPKGLIHKLEQQTFITYMKFLIESGKLSKIKNSINKDQDTRANNL